jgi:hypothetical protein
MIRAALFLLLSTAFSVSGEMCSWCESGDSECDWTYSDFARSLFPTSITNLVEGRGFPYFHPSAQQPFDSYNEHITLAVIVHHGNARNGQDYCSYMANAVLNNGGSLESTLVICPQVYEPGDEGLNMSTMIWWTNDEIGDRNWKWGGNSTVNLAARISTFSVYDEMTLKIADPNLHPNLKRIVFAGHSAGGQVAQRYALFSLIGEGGAQSDSMPSDIKLSYYAANPSSTTYLSAERPIAIQESDRDCNYCVNTTISTQQWRFEVPSEDDGSAASGCLATYNRYGYGLEGHLADYPATVTPDAARFQYALRDVIYMSGESDICDAVYQNEQNCTTCESEDGGLDISCEGHAQGWCRMARLHAFSQYVNRVVYKKPVHALMSVPYVGHSGCGMFQSAAFAESALS